MPCSRPSSWMSLRCLHGTRYAHPIPCRKCPDCRRAWAAKHQRRMLLGWRLSGSPPVAFLTLSTAPVLGRYPPWPQINRWWNSYLKWLRSINPGLRAVIAREEGFRTGMRHLHVLLVNWEYVWHGTLSREWEKRSGAAVVWIKRVDLATMNEMTGYTAKYMTKVVDSRLARVITFSRGWPRLEGSQLTRLAFLPRLDSSQWDVPVAWGGAVSSEQVDLHEYCGCFGDEVASVIGG